MAYYTFFGGGLCRPREVMEELNHIGAWMEPGLTSEDEEKAAEESMMMMIAFNELQY